ncbi:hypothetical protein HAX54_046435 [Datura stramonium]|uniref:F-box domain-containing protein n=1 Tax=Datura stramonium TaxID=4076 RepID=A0ABS8WKM9_DATST|nr:hypothetical protein [Datura stramonium]
MHDEEVFLISQTIETPTNCRTNSVDPTMQLPDHILQSIFSHLNFHDLVHVRLVSKNWHRNTPSHFALHFNESLFHEKNPTNKSDFWDWIRSSLDASNTNKLINVEKRVLRVKCDHPGDIRDVLGLLGGNHFHEVYLSFKLLRTHCYYLPYIFQSKFLTLLHLTECGIHNRVFYGTEEIFPSLQELKLDKVTVCEVTLSMFISKCPCLSELSLLNCWGICFIVLTKLDRLKKLYVKLSYFHSFTYIRVIAPSLQVFHFVHRSRERRVAVNMDIRACKMLREFHLDCWRFPQGLDPENISSHFPRLETLLLGPCQTEKPIKIKISGPLLTKWILSFPGLYECSRKSIVSTPNNLSSFQYMGTMFQPYLALPSDTSKVLGSSNIVLIPKTNEVNRAWFLKLRSHLENFSNYNTILDLRLREKGQAKWTSSNTAAGSHQALNSRHEQAQKSTGIFVEIYN